MKHCPNGGSTHKPFYVRLSAQVVQCMAAGCNTPLMSILTEKDPEWKIWSKLKRPENHPADETAPGGIIPRPGGGIPTHDMDFNVGLDEILQERTRPWIWVNRNMTMTGETNATGAPTHGN